MSRRNWRPKGEGFRRIFDNGRTAMWLRREGKELTGVVYIDYEWDESRNGIWTFSAEVGSPLIYEVYDKPHRIAWIDQYDQDSDWLRATLISRKPVPGGPPRGVIRHRSARRNGRRVRPSMNNWMPRKFRV